jgi:hypothetical protein
MIPRRFHRPGHFLLLVLVVLAAGCATWKPVPAPVDEVLARPGAPKRLNVHLRDGSSLLLLSPAVRGDSLYGRSAPARHTAFPDRTGATVAVALAEIHFVEVEDSNDAASVAIVVAIGLALWLSLSAIALGEDLVDDITW